MLLLSPANYLIFQWMAYTFLWVYENCAFKSYVTTQRLPLWYSVICAKWNSNFLLFTAFFCEINSLYFLLSLPTAWIAISLPALLSIDAITASSTSFSLLFSIMCLISQVRWKKLVYYPLKINILLLMHQRCKKLWGIIFTHTCTYTHLHLNL